MGRVQIEEARPSKVPLLALAAGSFLFAELLSGNIPFPLIAHPFVVLMLTIAYGFPVLLIREFAVRRGLGLWSLWLLGLAYGIYNEGLVARTLLQAHGPPLFPAYNDYGVHAGINWPWLLTVVPFHALGSIMYPIAIVSVLWPREARRPWLGKTGCVALLAGALSLTLLFFKKPPLGSPLHYGAFLAAIAILTALASLLAALAPLSSGAVRSGWKQALLGLGPMVYIAILQGLAGRHVYFGGFLFASFLIFTLLALLFRKQERRSPAALALFGIGNYFATALIRMGSPSRSLCAFEPLWVGGAFSLGLLALAWRVREASLA